MVINNTKSEIYGVKYYTAKELSKIYNVSTTTLNDISKTGAVDCNILKHRLIFFWTDKTKSFIENKYSKRDNIHNINVVSNGQKFKDNLLLLDKPLKVEENVIVEEKKLDEKDFISKVNDGICCEFEFYDYKIIEESTTTPAVILTLKLFYQPQNTENATYFYTFKDDKIPIKKQSIWKFIAFFRSLDWDFEAHKQVNLGALFDEALHHSGTLQIKRITDFTMLTAEDYSIEKYNVKNVKRECCPKEEKWLTVVETAKKYNASEATLYRLIRKKQIIAKKDIYDKWLIREDENNIKRLKQIEPNRKLINEYLHKTS